MKRQELEQQQTRQLNELIAKLVGKNPFYTEKLRAAKIDQGIRSLAEFTSNMPFTTKNELLHNQKQHPPYGTNLTYPLKAYCRFHQTSGTTASPLRWIDTVESWAWVVRNWFAVFEAAQVTQNSCVMFAFSFGPFLGFWSAMDAAKEIGCLCLSGGGMSSEGRLQLMRDHQADVLCCTPTYALRLAEVAQEKRIPLDQLNIKKIIVAGEPGGSIPEIRLRVEQAWGNDCRLFDHHGMTEVGPVSYECIDTPRVLHINESSYLAEILDPNTLMPVQEEQPGELVLTTLGRDAAPLLRYRTGDVVYPSWKGKPEFCSDDLALIGGIVGRIDDMVVVRGVNIYPSTVDSIIRSVDGVQEYRVIVERKSSLTELSIELELRQNYHQNGVVSQLQEAFRNTLHLRVPITVVEPNTLPRFEMKAKRWVKL